MVKICLKVAFTTIIAILLVVAFSLMSIAVFTPSKMSGIYNDIGFRYRAKVYAEKAFEKSENINDLATLVNLSIKCNDNESTFKYAGMLLKNGEFEKYLSTIEQPSVYRDYIASEYIKTGYVLEKWTKTELVNRALNYARAEYRYSNPIENLILHAYERSDAEVLSLCQTVLINYQASGACPTDSANRLQQDITNLAVLIERVNKA